MAFPFSGAGVEGVVQPLSGGGLAPGRGVAFEAGGSGVLLFANLVDSPPRAIAAEGQKHDEQTDYGPAGRRQEAANAPGDSEGGNDHRAHSPVLPFSQVRNCPTVLPFRMVGFAAVACGPAIRSARASTSAPMTLAAMPAPKKWAA